MGYHAQYPFSISDNPIPLNENNAMPYIFGSYRYDFGINRNLETLYVRRNTNQEMKEYRTLQAGLMPYNG
jgi:hypothetical protein